MGSAEGIDDADLERVLLRAVRDFATGRGPGGSRMLVRYPGTAPNRPNAADYPDNDPLAHLQAFVLRAPPFVQGVTNGWAIWTRRLQIDIVIRADIGDLPALAYVKPLRDAFPVTERLIGANHEYAITKPVAVGQSGDIPGWRIVSTELEVKVAA